MRFQDRLKKVKGNNPTSDNGYWSYLAGARGLSASRRPGFTFRFIDIAIVSGLHLVIFICVLTIFVCKWMQLGLLWLYIKKIVAIDWGRVSYSTLFVLAKQ